MKNKGFAIHILIVFLPITFLACSLGHSGKTQPQTNKTVEEFALDKFKEMHPDLVVDFGQPLGMLKTFRTVYGRKKDAQSGSYFQQGEFRLLVAKDGAIYAPSDACKLYAKEDIWSPDVSERKKIVESLWSIRNWEGFHKTLSSVQDIPYYEKNPLPKDQEAMIKPLSMKIDAQGNEQWTIYSYFAFASRVERCTIEFSPSKHLTGNMRSDVFATGVGDTTPRIP